MKKTYVFRDDAPVLEIRDPNLPQPWIHYLSNGELHAFASQAGGGFAWWKDAVACRLSRYRMFHLPMDRPGFYLYITHNGTTFCPTHQPVCAPVEDWRSTLEPGKVTYRSLKDGILARQEMFITPEENLLVWDVTLENRGDEPAELDLTAYTELAQQKWLTEQMYGYYWRHMLKTWREENLLCYLYQFREDSDYLEPPLVFFGSSGEMASFSTDRNAFMGHYRDESNPEAVEKRQCGGETMLSGEPCFAYHVKKILAPGEIDRVCWFMGVAENGLTDIAAAKENAFRMAERCRDLRWLDGQKDLLAKNWARYLHVAGCVLPDKDMERMISTWAPINCMTTARYSRAVNVEAPGVRGQGFRDTTQDMIAVCCREPEMAEEILMRLLSKQFATGNAVHLVPLNPKELPDARTRCDSHLWLPLLLYSLLTETGDYSVLDRQVPYLSPEDLVSRDISASVWAHMMAAMDFTESHLGEHGLPLTMKGDWNDIIGKFSTKGRGESVFASMQYILCLKLLSEIARIRCLPEAEMLAKRCDKQMRAVETAAFNGKWWYRCFDDAGQPVGGPDSLFGKLWLNPQSWAVISGVGSKEQRQAGMDSAEQILRTDTGLRLIWPGFKTYPEVTDPFTGYNPGNGENGAVFCHSNGWAVIAAAMLGQGQRAWEYYELLCPQKALERVGLDTYRAEPYAWASNIVGPENPKHGWANVTHITGTAAWMDIAANQFLLGIRPGLKGVAFAPVMKKCWQEMSAWRLCRGTEISVTVRNPQGAESGIWEFRVDGVRMEEPFLTWEFLAGKEKVNVEILLGGNA